MCWRLFTIRIIFPVRPRTHRMLKIVIVVNIIMVIRVCLETLAMMMVVYLVIFVAVLVGSV